MSEKKVVYGPSRPVRPLFGLYRIEGKMENSGSHEEDIRTEILSAVKEDLEEIWHWNLKGLNGQFENYTAALAELIKRQLEKKSMEVNKNENSEKCENAGTSETIRTDDPKDGESEPFIDFSKC